MTLSLSSDQGMLTMRVLSLLVVFLCASSAWAQSQEIKNPVPPITNETKGANKPKDNTNSQQTITVEFPPTINPIVGGKLEMKSEDGEAKKHNEATNWAEWFIAGFTGLLVIVTAWLVYYTKKLWASTGDLVRGAEETAKRQLRAYVSVVTAEILDVTTGFTPRAHLIFKNSGQTPAYDLTAIIGIAIGDSWDTLTPPASQPIAITITSLAADAKASQYVSSPRPLVLGER